MPKPLKKICYTPEEDKVLLDWLSLPKSQTSLRLSQASAFKNAAIYLSEADISPVLRTWQSVKKHLDIIKHRTHDGKIYNLYCNIIYEN